MKKKYFLISIDAEGDDFWRWSPTDPITAKNGKYVQRFQELCEKYGLIPTYLVNYEMANCKEFAEYIREKASQGLCEVGMHLHAWNTPPLYEISIRNDIKPGECSYLIEYPHEIMKAKIHTMTDVIKNVFGVAPITHRAGRWGINDEYLSLLFDEGYIADCSVAPNMDMRSGKGFSENGAGIDFTGFPKNTYLHDSGIIEVPMTVRENHTVKKDGNRRIKHIIRKIYKALVGRGIIWLRPSGNNLNEMLYLAKKVKFENTDYAMFMLHTSEMMPGGSPTFETEISIEQMYSDIEKLFSYVSKDFQGISIGEYAKRKSIKLYGK